MNPEGGDRANKLPALKKEEDSKGNNTQYRAKCTSAVKSCNRTVLLCTNKTVN